MSEDRSGVRLRQAVLVVSELEPAAAVLRDGLGLGEPFRDPGVAQFGLINAVFALGDCFLEVVSPTQPDTAAGRYMARQGGDGGYMAIFDLEDLEGALARAEQLGIRVVWRIGLPDISANHLHPADMRGAIVSLDRSKPYGTWRWGGPEWTGRTGRGAPGRLAGITVAVDDPASVSARWAQILGVSASGGEPPTLHIDGSEVCFVVAPDEHAEGLVEIAVELPPELRRERDAIELGRARVRLLDAS
jgi:Glyoxalase-like domain